jgi:hypothetical protein
VLLLELSSQKFVHCNYNTENNETEINNLLKKYNYSLDNLVKDMVRNFYKELISLSDSKSIKKLMNIIDNNIHAYDARYEFADEIYSIFMKTTQFYEINNLYFQDELNIKKRLFNVMIEDESYNHITKYFNVEDLKK